MKASKQQQLLTIGEIARLGAPIHRVEYAVQSLGIRPPSRAGALRVFDDADLNTIAGALSRARDRMPADGASQGELEGGAK